MVHRHVCDRRQTRRTGPRRPLIALAGLALLACTPLACQKVESRPRVLIVGIDGASPRVIDKLFAEGRMPHLRELARKGVYGPLKSMVPLLSPRVWTTVATGKFPRDHGIFGWVKAGDGAKAELYYGTDRKTHALWNILSDAGKTVAVVNWLVTYPPEIVNGVIVSDHALPSELEGKRAIGEVFAKMGGSELEAVRSAASGPGAVYPPEWNAKALDPRHEAAELTHVPSPFQEGAKIGFDDSLGVLRGFRSTDQRLASVTLEILDERRPELTMLLLQGIDRISHFIFGCLDDPSTYPATFRPTAQERANCQEALYGYYEFTDQMIGRLLERFGDNDLVLVISDHGFEAEFQGHMTGNHNSPAALDGICIASGPRVRPGAPVAPMAVADVTPTVLAWLGLPLGADMTGKPAPFLAIPGGAAPGRIPTYDTRPIERLGEGESPAAAKVVEQLRSLGYVE